MKTEDISETLVQMFYKLTEGESVDIRHDKLLTSEEVQQLIGITEPTLRKAIKAGKFPAAVIIAGQKRWPTSLINEHIRQSNQHLINKEELQSQAAQIVREA